MMAVAQKPDEPRSQPHPVVQETVRQERLQFINPLISHAKALMVVKKGRAGNQAIEGRCSGCGRALTTLTKCDRPHNDSHWRRYTLFQCRFRESSQFDSPIQKGFSDSDSQPPRLSSELVNFGIEVCRHIC